jgi:hypothetical protein
VLAEHLAAAVAQPFDDLADLRLGAEAVRHWAEAARPS